MTLSRVALLLFVGLLVGMPAAMGRRASDASKQPPRTIAAFRLSDPRDGKVVDSARWKDSKAIVVVFLGTECPINNDYLLELARLHKVYSVKGVSFVGVNANLQDTPVRVAEHARRHKVPFPIVKDPANQVADLFSATPNAGGVPP